jgi:ABC-type antimicrobial peptide transport system permease subunit
MVFLSLIFDIVIVIFVIISVLLIYSLLMVSVETKTMQIGIMRMIGLGKNSFISMILVQSIMFTIPAIILSLISSIPLLAFIYTKVF